MGKPAAPHYMSKADGVSTEMRSSFCARLKKENIDAANISNSSRGEESVTPASKGARRNSKVEHFVAGGLPSEGFFKMRPMYGYDADLMSEVFTSRGTSKNDVN